MKRKLMIAIAAIALTAGSGIAHDASKHKGKPVQGEVVSSAGDRFELKTETGVIPVTFSSKTKFEHGNATVDKTHVTKGTQVSVFGTKLPSGEMVAREVLIGDGNDHGQHAKSKETASPKDTPEAHKH